MDAPRWLSPPRSGLVALAVVVVVALGLWVGFTLLGTPVTPLPTAEWGPLAVARTPEQPAARGAGTVRITETCVGLVDPIGRGALLVWPVDRVAWLAADRAVSFRNLDGSVHLLRDGDDVVLQGGGGGVGADGQPADRRFDWVAPPDPGCSFAEYFLVADVMSD